MGDTKMEGTALALDEREDVTQFRPDALIALLRSWDEGDQEEQAKSFAELIKALDEDRPEGRKLFPEHDHSA